MAQGFLEIASFDAKTRLPELLREVQGGQRFTITVRGKPVADLVPSAKDGRPEVAEAIAALRALKRIRGVDPATVQSWLEEGRC
ncbi:MAG: type II toxin-antitoxin system prevent-host-death family antitoxin [Rhodocyclaceae bacterium]|nr:type II toxin-antitoxin system prevent-host-death family antitoxin [Rhodocyclaceae bacterium]